MFRAIGFPELFVIAAYLTVMIVPFWRIFRRLGFSKWLSLWMVVPGIELIVLFYVAFTEPNPKPTKPA